MCNELGQIDLDELHSKRHARARSHWHKDRQRCPTQSQIRAKDGDVTKAGMRDLCLAVTYNGLFDGGV